MADARITFGVRFDPGPFVAHMEALGAAATTAARALGFLAAATRPPTRVERRAHRRRIERDLRTARRHELAAAYWRRRGALDTQYVQHHPWTAPTSRRTTTMTTPEPERCGALGCGARTDGSCSRGETCAAGR